MSSVSSFQVRFLDGSQINVLIVKKKIVYIAHPIGGDVTANIQKILNIVRDINLTMPDVVPFAPYIADVLIMDDSKPEERAIGISNDHKIIESGIVNELWIYGERISAGMVAEIELAEKHCIPIVLMTRDTELPLSLLNKNNTDL
jgi:hypothetical protein